MRVGGGRGHTRAGMTSAFSTTLTMPQRDQATVRFVRLTPPKMINARLSTINDACNRAKLESDISKCSHATAGPSVAVTRRRETGCAGRCISSRTSSDPELFVASRGQVDFDPRPSGSVAARAATARGTAGIRAADVRIGAGPTPPGAGPTRGWRGIWAEVGGAPRVELETDVGAARCDPHRYSRQAVLY